MFCVRFRDAFFFFFFFFFGGGGEGGRGGATGIGMGVRVLFNISGIVKTVCVIFFNHRLRSLVI